MDFILNDILAGELVPVLLGCSAEANETAHRMYRKYGVISHLFCEKIPLSMRLSFCTKFHTVAHASSDRLLVEALLDFSGQLENADVILYLIPCTERDTALIWNHLEELESRFVIADKAELGRIWHREYYTERS